MTKRLNMINNITSSTALVPYGDLQGSTVGMKISSYTRSNTRLNVNQKSVFLGTLLGDAHLSLNKRSINASWVHSQALKNIQYSCHLFMELWNFCLSIPGIKISMSSGIKYPATVVFTRSYPFFTEFLNIFYVNKIKVIPIEYLLLHLYSKALAYWIIDDGSKSTNGGIRLHTESYTWVEVYKLAGLFHYLFDIKCSVQKTNNSRPLLYIHKSSINKLRHLVVPHILPMFRYKIGC